MKKYKNIFFLFAAGFVIAPVISGAEGKKPQESIVVLDSDPGNFEKDSSDAAVKMKEALRMMRRNKFFGNLYETINKGNFKKAEELLNKKVQDSPEYIKDENYRVAKSKISYAKGDYQSAYAEADKFISDIEKAFAPKKPYEINFKDKDVRAGVQYAYILRYQAAGQLLHYDEALIDLDHALLLKTTPELLRAKTGALLALKKYPEAAEAAEKAYGMDKNVFVSSPYRDHYCWLFSEQGYNVKSCGYFAALATEKAATAKTDK